MKKLAAIIGASALATGAFAQGLVTFANTSGTVFHTNSIGLGGTAGNTAGGAANVGTFDYEVLTAPSTTTTVDASLQGLLAGGWSDTGILGQNTAFASGGRMGASGTLSASNWVAGAQQTFIVIGWSANIGNFATLEADLRGASLVAASGGGFYWSGISNAAPSEFIGATTIQSAVSGGGAQSLPAFALFGSVSAQGTPVTTTTELYAVAVPEPTTFALMGLAASSLLIFRRRK